MAIVAAAAALDPDRVGNLAYALLDGVPPGEVTAMLDIVGQFQAFGR